MLSEFDRREQQRRENKRRARVALGVDMLKSYAAPVILAGVLNPLLQSGSGPLRLGALNYLLLIAGLAMIGLALIFVPERS